MRWWPALLGSAATCGVLLVARGVGPARSVASFDVGESQMAQARMLEDAGAYGAAAEIFGQVPPESACHEEAQIRRSLCLAHARMLREPANSPVRCVAERKLAFALEQQARDLEAKDPRSKELKPLRRRICRWYVASQQANLEDPNPAAASELELVANRVFALAASLNDVPSFASSAFLFEREQPLAEPQYLDEVVKLYTARLALGPSNTAAILRAEAHLFLGNWDEAASSYAALFERVHLVDVRGRFRRAPDTLGSGLHAAYVEWAVTEHLAATAHDDAKRLASARKRLEIAVQNTAANSRQGWLASYHLARCCLELGDSAGAEAALKAVERHRRDFQEDRFGFKARFVALREELDRRPPR